MEHDEQVTLFEALELFKNEHPALPYIFAIPNGGHRHPKVAQYMKAEGVKRGVPDLCVPFASREYHGLYIEMKYGDNRLSPEQKRYKKYLEENGYLFKVCYSSKEAIDEIFDYLGLNKQLIQFL